jgi:hypothetical protein
MSKIKDKQKIAGRNRGLNRIGLPSYLLRKGDIRLTYSQAETVQKCAGHHQGDAMRSSGTDVFRAGGSFSVSPGESRFCFHTRPQECR